MQITIVQSEIEQAIKQFVLGRLNVDGPQDVAIELKATRGETGMQAVIDITLGAEKPAPSRPAQRVVTPATKPAPVITTADLKRMHAEEEAAEAEAEGASTEAAVEAEAAVEEGEAVSEEAVAATEEAQGPAPEAAPAPVAPVAPEPAPTTRPATQVAGAAPGPAGAPPKRLFAGFARPTNTGA